MCRVGFDVRSAYLVLAAAASVPLANVPAQAQSVRFETVLPSATEPAISGWNTNHVAAFATTLSAPTTRRNQVFIYLHGQGGTGTGANELLRTAAEQGFHVIGLTYPNDWSPFNLCAGDPACPEAMRLEILDGTDRTQLIAVARADSIENRAIRLLQHLAAAHPTENWSQFVSNGTVAWDKVVLWGHSQGGGNAGVIARTHAVARVCLSAPAADGGAGNPAAWWATHATPSDRYFGLCHTQDALATKVAFWSALGMGQFGGVVDVATVASPYNSTHSLSTSVAPAVAGQYHNSVVADAVTPRDASDVPVYKPVWQYMMTSSLGGGGGNSPTWNDLVYATVPTVSGDIDLHMDIFAPTNGEAGPAPLVVWIHGGGWQNGSHDSANASAVAMRDEGYVVASIEYRLSQEAIFPAQIHDCKGAIRYLRAHAASFGIDPGRIGVWGSSAGGHLVALLGTSSGVIDAEGFTGGNLNVSSRVQAVADYFGPTDFFGVEGWHTQCTPTTPEASLLGACLGDIQANQENPLWSAIVANTRLAAPLTHVSHDDPPFHIAHGSIDTTVWPEHSENLFAALTLAQVPATLRIVEGSGHGLPASEAVFVREFFSRHIGPTRCIADLDDDGVTSNASEPDGAVDINDLLFFLGVFESGDARADLANSAGVGTPDGGVDISDLLFFLGRFEGGC